MADGAIDLDPLALRVELLRLAHRRHTYENGAGRVIDYCRGCDQRWPCSTVNIIDGGFDTRLPGDPGIDDIRARADAVQSLRRELAAWDLETANLAVDDFDPSVPVSAAVLHRRTERDAIAELLRQAVDALGLDVPRLLSALGDRG